MEIIWQPLINLLIVFYHLLFGNLGLAIIAFTGFLRFILTPVTLPSMRMTQKMRDFAPQLSKLKKKYGKDKKKLMQAQADFYKEKGINPAAGCLPQIVQLVILIALFRGFITIFGGTGEITEKLNNVLYPLLHISGEVDKYFLGVDLTKPDVFIFPNFPFPVPGLFLILSAVFQFLASKMMTPQVIQAEKVGKSEGGFEDAASSMQGQMLYLFPILTLFIGISFPAGLVIYWGSLSLFQMIQQYFVSGWGGLSPLIQRVNLLKYNK